MPGASDRQTADQELLDEVFERTVARVEEGRPPEFTDLLAGREDLWPEAEKLIHLAQQVAVGQRPMLPKIDGYTILGELGRGGMGTVYLAQQERLGRRLVALKVLSSSVALSPSARERFRSEALAIARLRHPNIVAVHDVVHEAGGYAYAMEWVEGKSLADVIAVLRPRGDKSDIAELRALLDAPAGVLMHDTLATFVCRVGIAIARALGAVHRAGLLHRDVKPGNILLRRDGTPLLTDFGLARGLDDVTVTQPGHFVGTPAYAAPEQLRGSTVELDARTDVYGLGVTLYHALTLRLPFQGSGTADLLRRIEAGQVEPLRRANPHLSADLQTIVAMAMEPDPARRYQTADELADDLERLLNLQPIQARPAGLMTRTVKLARRNRGAVVGAVLGGALALLLTIIATWYLFIVPRWVERHVRDARLALLAPKLNDAIFEVIYWPRDTPDLTPWPDDYLRSALAHYRAALRLRPTDGDIRLERDTVQLARDLAVHPERSPELPARVVESAPLTCAWARNRTQPAGSSPPVARQPGQASSVDLRCLGLLAYLCADAETALQAWSRMDLLMDPDPLVEASLGQLYLLRDEPARAYPRLRNAFRAFPEAGFLCVSLADAALQCGDTTKAEQLLDRAGRLARLDATVGLQRVRADLYAATGRDDLARELYGQITGWRGESTAVTHYHFARFLEDRGDLQKAMEQYALAVSAAPFFEGARRAVVRVSERWWGDLDVPQRWAILQRALRDDPTPPNFPFPLGRYWHSVRWLVQRAAKDGQTPPTSTAPAKQPAAAVSTMPAAGPAARQLGLWEVVQGMRLYDGALWSRFRAYPYWLQELQIAVWLLPYGECGSLWIERLDGLLRSLPGLQSSLPLADGPGSPPATQGSGSPPSGS